MAKREVKAHKEMSEVNTGALGQIAGMSLNPTEEREAEFAIVPSHSVIDLAIMLAYNALHTWWVEHEDTKIRNRYYENGEFIELDEEKEFMKMCRKLGIDSMEDGTEKIEKLKLAKRCFQLGVDPLDEDWVKLIPFMDEVEPSQRECPPLLSKLLVHSLFQLTRAKDGQLLKYSIMLAESELATVEDEGFYGGSFGG